jgi:hypothetical protein
MLEELADEGPGSGRRIEDVDVAVDEIPTEVLLAQPIGALDHEADDLVGRIDDPQAVRGLYVIDLVEVLVDRLQERLFLVVARDLRGGRADRRVVRC